MTYKGNGHHPFIAIVLLSVATAFYQVMTLLKEAI